MTNKTDLLPPAGTTHTIKSECSESPLWNVIKALGNKCFYFNGTQWVNSLDESYLEYYLKYYDAVTHETIPTETPEETEAFNKMKPYEFDEHVSVAKVPSEKMKVALKEATDNSDRIGVMINRGEVKLVDANDDKPIFTQAMSDAGELPPVGSDFLHNGEVVLCISTTSHDGGVVTFRRLTQGNGPDIACCWNNKSWVKPILIPSDTRTPKQKAVDSMKELLDGKWCSEYAEILYDAGYRK